MFAFRRSHNTLRIHEKRRETGKINAKHIFYRTTKGRGHKKSTLTVVISFKIYLESFPIQKLFNFFKFSLLYKCPKSLSKSTLMSLNWETAFKQEITKWRLRWSIRPPDVPFQLFQRLLWNHLIKPCRFLCSKTFLTYPISACAAERSFTARSRWTEKRLHYVIQWQMSDFHPCRFYIYIMLLTSLNLRNKRGGSSPCVCKHSNTAQRRTTRTF